ncbi:CDP-glycerol glycerophosphotransferase family protein [Litchfieldia alkalitelluris]|uniref:CDP-glycerol glycerophosphotransferase family protein n=1 Tax=Litchfieldia alkalitelluris TaxID=304268 RepID=UPI001F3F4013|nr:CDP-glycerol glycerophosphotransferase family protein [Litchfieldia alkalitelluris]
MNRKKRDKNCYLDLLYFQDHNLYIQIVCSKLISDGHLKLLFVERYTTKKREFILTGINDIEHKYEVSLQETDLQHLMSEGKDWDVYVTNESNTRIRLSSNDLELELLFYLNEGQMLTPFTTNNGNVSFKSQLPQLISKVDQIDFINKDRIAIKGYVVNPLWKEQPVELKRTLILRTNDDEFSYKIPLKIVELNKIAKQYNHGGYNFLPIGFEAVFSITDLVSKVKNDSVTLKARIELNYYEENKTKTTETPPIKLKSPSFKKKSLVKKVDANKKLISISRTKKARQLNISMNEYNFKNHIKARVKKRFLSIKGHSLVKNIYKKAFHYIGLMPTKTKKIVVFESFLGKQFSDNPRAIYEYLKEINYPYKLYWSVDKKFLHNFQDKDLNIIRRFSVKWLLIMPRARFWVTNCRLPLWLPKPKNTIYFQTWHGTPLKRLAADMDEVYMPGTTAESYKKNFVKEAQNWDYLISPNAYSTEIFQRAFQFEKEVLETGYPRNDFICNNDNMDTINKLRASYGIPSAKKVILYAPTWRDNQFYAKGKYRFDINLDLDLLQEKLGKDYVILFRLHYLISENLDLSPYEGFAYDFSNHEDIRELYLMADVLMTDYSSVFFDYGNLKRPMIFYVYDIEQYRDNLRGFYFDFEQEAPGPLVKTTEEVIQTVKEMEANDFQMSQKFDAFYEKFCYLECGDSTRKVVEKVFL